MLGMKTCIGTVAEMGGVPAVLRKFHQSFKNMTLWSSEYMCAVGQYIHYPDPPDASVHDAVRNLYSATMMGEWLVQLDSDHQFDPDIVSRLLYASQKYGVDVVTGLYQHKEPPHLPVIYKYSGGRLLPLVKWDSRAEAIEVDGAGAGCLLVHKRVFKRIRETKEAPFDRIGGMGEDLSFFLRLKKLKIPAICVPAIQCHHIEQHAVDISQHDPSKLDLNKPEKIKGYGRRN